MFAWNAVEKQQIIILWIPDDKAESCFFHFMFIRQQKMFVMKCSKYPCMLHDSKGIAFLLSHDIKILHAVTSDYTFEKSC